MKENYGNTTKLSETEVKALLRHLLVLQIKGVPLTEVTRKTGVSRSSMSAWRAGAYRPSAQAAKKIYTKFPGEPDDL